MPQLKKKEKLLNSQSVQMPQVTPA